MTSSIRYAIWAAVSTTEQAADDKFSLSTQIETSRAYVQAKGWHETAGPYIVPGETRARWVNLRDAANAIPALNDLLNDARDGKYNVLVMREYDRFRDLIDLVATVLNHYGIQLYSIGQQVEPIPPEAYNPYASDSEQSIRQISKISSKMAINSARRKYYEQMPKRVTELGINAISIPYGYRKPIHQASSPKAIPEPIPEITPYIIAMKDMFLAGQSLRQIVAWLHQNNAPTPRGGPTWHSRVVKDILLNPFYAGQNRFGVSRVYYDLLEGNKPKRDRRTNPDRLITSPGKHTPLWDMATHNAILAEFSRRPRNYRGQISHRFTGILACAVCESRLHIQYRYLKDTAKNNAVFWRCSKAHAAHISIREDLILEPIIDAIYNAIQSQTVATTDQLSTQLTSELADLQTRKKRLDDAYESGVMDLTTYSERINKIKIAMAENKTKLAAANNQAAETQLRQAAIQSLASPETREFLRFGEQQLVNHLLRSLNIEILLASDGTVTKIRPKAETGI